MIKLDDTQKAKIERFLLDESLSSTIFSVLLGKYVEKRPHVDVNMAAAERIAIDLLHDAWKELERFRPSEEHVDNITKQVGL